MVQDVIIKVNDERINDSSKLKNIISSGRPRDKTKLTIIRKWIDKNILVTLGTRPDEDDLVQINNLNNKKFDILGLIVERTFLRPMVGEPVFSVDILTIGIDILLRTTLDNWIGLNPRYMGDPFPTFGNFGSAQFSGVTIKYLEIAALTTAILIIIALNIFF